MENYTNQSRSTAGYEKSTEGASGVTPAQGGAYVMPPPPMGYPGRDAPPAAGSQPAETRFRGDGFWKGCCAGLCCCCALDMCF